VEGRERSRTIEQSQVISQQFPEYYEEHEQLLRDLNETRKDLQKNSQELSAAKEKIHIHEKTIQTYDENCHWLRCF
jgi:chromosome segregation ATPase